MLFGLEPWYFVAIAPAILLMLWAQMRVRSSYAQAMQVDAPLLHLALQRHAE